MDVFFLAPFAFLDCDELSQLAYYIAAVMARAQRKRVKAADASEQLQAAFDLLRMPRQAAETLQVYDRVERKIG